jgi:arylformamidase
MPTMIDVTLPMFEGCVSWPSHGEAFSAEPLARIAHGDVCNTTAFRCSAHLGTHLDAPRHFIDDGPPIDQVDLDLLIGPADVVEVICDAYISAEQLDAAVETWPERLLLRTRNSTPGGALDKPAFDKAYCGIALDAAELIVAKGVKLLGIDYLSFGPYGDNPPVHRAILGAGIPALEGLDLRRVEPGRYNLIALPLKLIGCDGAPVRAILTR